ncbi:MAG TPA: hypothetical protein DEB30_01380 [Candidatus Peribacter riflensis]|uniref:Uncharacterized protein n=1 Tax=Candidatus Peribacter riflensis TaxID=1735162 RepID=A0A0S1SJV3_9BACT|nr:MAG: hypothetical protein PeribacterA2_0001 [Candidatus Peribacter riflensis]OGJ78115.1 MAG: hypothetical protein A2398_01780 [Candidatus Peribacteria bacterium RIFOXYB1_FULL_57_12]OGJ82212.1 MAG: hypothetical protein A2412_01975 [Candidatus Peribacteria bacterium RIFOXYC1_FULL_58_8]ALM10501.1 MAG: hypothetical protein PeribacterB2_0001 [Candidatus Peribacter riflensis]ALM11604.1 MAG: hypothetical protein PeribacterC2_0001 [Candidatus Peribacter riflensis]
MLQAPSSSEELIAQLTAQVGNEGLQRVCDLCGGTNFSAVDLKEKIADMAEGPDRKILQRVATIIARFHETLLGKWNAPA